MAQIDDHYRGSTTEPDTPPDPVQAPRRFVFAHLIPSSQVARLAVERTRDHGSVYHSKFITNIKYREDPSTPCFEIALDELPDFPDKGWFIGRGRRDRSNMGVDLLLDTARLDNDTIAGVHARLSWIRDAGGFFLIASNHRRKHCTVNGEDFSIFSERRPIPFSNTILIGEYPFTLQYVHRDQLDEDRFQISLKAFMSEFLGDSNPFVLPTPREQDSRFGDWIVQCPLGRSTYGTVYMVIHAADGRRAAAKQLFMTKYNSGSTEREVRMAHRISQLSHEGIASPFDIRRLKCQTDAEVARIRNLLGQEWDPAQQGNITDEIIIFSPLLHGNLRAVISSPTVSELSRAVFFAKILSAVGFLHANGLCHRDIKPDNILIESLNPPVPKITDFGCASDESSILYDKPGTIAYLAPEQVEGKHHAFPVDYWACGLVGVELLSKEETRNRIVPGPQLHALQKRMTDFKCTVKFMPFCCRRMLDNDPENRMTAEEAFNVLRLRGEAALQMAISGVSREDTEHEKTVTLKKAKIG